MTALVIFQCFCVLVDLIGGDFFVVSPTDQKSLPPLFGLSERLKELQMLGVIESGVDLMEYELFAPAAVVLWADIQTQSQSETKPEQDPIPKSNELSAFVSRVPPATTLWENRRHESRVDWLCVNEQS